MVPGNPHPTRTHARSLFTRRASAYGLQPARWANSFEVNRASLQEAKPRQPACARGLSGLAALRWMDVAGAIVIARSGTQWPKPHLRRIPPIRRPTERQTRRQPMSRFSQCHARGQKQQASASGERMGKHVRGARPREGLQESTVDQPTSCGCRHLPAR